MNKREAVNNREKGTAPLSIGTSLALESLCGFGEFENDKPHIDKIDELRVNLRTLFRNFLGSIDKYVRETGRVSDFIDYFAEDLLILSTTIEQRSKGRVKVSFFLPKYTSAGFNKRFPKGILKVPKTAKQVLEHNLEEDVLKLFMSKPEYKERYSVDSVDFDDKYRGDKTCILTNYPADLLNASHYSKLWLLESHSGGIKSNEQWYTKLTGGKNLHSIPFNKLTLQVFGDNNTLFSARERKLKTALIELSEQKGWSSVTTIEKVKFDIWRMQNGEEKALLKELL